jgi:hypothetical protein
MNKLPTYIIIFQLPHPHPPIPRGPNQPPNNDDGDDGDDNVPSSKITTCGFQNLLSICVRKIHRLVLKKA